MIEEDDVTQDAGPGQEQHLPHEAWHVAQERPQNGEPGQEQHLPHEAWHVESPRRRRMAPPPFQSGEDKEDASEEDKG